MENESFYFPVFSGLLSPEHHERIGPALWEFLWCISSTTEEKTTNDETWGIVLGGKPIKYPDIAKEIGKSSDSVKRNFKRLQENGYIYTKRTPYGQKIAIRKSKKYRKGKNALSEMRDRAKTHDRKGKNALCNKDMQVDIFATSARKGESGGVPLPESSSCSKESVGQIPISNAEEALKNKFMALAAIPGFDLPETDKASIREVLNAGVDPNDALEWLVECFKEFKPKHSRDRINSFNYCVGKILDKHHKKNNPKAKGKRKKQNDALSKIHEKWFGTG